MAEPRRMITTEELARILGKSIRYVQLLAKGGTLTFTKERNKNMYDLYMVIQEYVEFVANSSNKEYTTLEESKVHEDVRYRRAKADMIELELKELDGQMHSAEDVEMMTTDLVLAVRSALLALPGMLGPDIASAGSAAEVSELIKKAVYEILDDLSKYEYNPEDFKKRVRERKGWQEQDTEEDDDDDPEE